MTQNIQEKVLKFESFINDRLKEDLKRLHDQWEVKTAEIAQWTQLKLMIQTMQEIKINRLKGQMDIGVNIFASVVVPDTRKIIVDVGAGVFVEFSLEEACQFIESKIKILKKEVDLIYNASCDVKARIKLVLHGIQEIEKIK